MLQLYTLSDSISTSNICCHKLDVLPLLFLLYKSVIFQARIQGGRGHRTPPPIDKYVGGHKPIVTPPPPIVFEVTLLAGKIYKK